MKNICLVSAYFEIKSKFPKEQYHQWMQNFLKIRTPMIIFTDSPELIIKYRLPNLLDTLRVIKTNLSDFLVYKYYEEWKEHLQMDHEKHIHTIELYMIWNEKANFIKRAIELNPYGTKYYYWTDIGAFRNTEHLNQFYLDYPNNITTDKILLLNIEPFEESEIKHFVDANAKSKIGNIFQYKNRIGGGIFGGEKNYCLQWWEKYYAVLDRFFENQQFAGKDQSVMAMTALLYPELVKVILPMPKYDPWFYLEEYLTK